MAAHITQISAGRGPEECCRVVARVLEIFLKEARAQNLTAEVVETVAGPLNGTLLSAMVSLEGHATDTFLKSWVGIVQWIAQSPYRKFHKRKNWFVGVQAFDSAQLFRWRDNEVQFETLRASGPGGQHVNKTESAVRARHIPSGIVVVASERRSQYQNKTEALERLQAKVKQWHIARAAAQAQSQWQQHNCLERGNAIRTFTERL
ncbi:MAG: peptide chain release factor H [Adhaeribacter sp.]